MWTKLVTRGQNVVLMFTKVYGWNEGFKQLFGTGFSKILLINKQGLTDYYVQDNELQRLLAEIEKRVLDETLPAEGISRFSEEIAYLRELPEEKLHTLSNAQLAELLEETFKKLWSPLPFLLLPTLVDDFLVAKIKQAIENREKNAGKVSETLALLTSFPGLSYVTVEEREFLQIAQEISKSQELRKLFQASPDVIEKQLLKTSPALFEKLRKHAEKYCWIAIQAEEEPLTLKYFISKMQTVLVTPSQIQTRLLQIAEYEHKLKQQKNEKMNSLKFNAVAKAVVACFEKWALLKDYRRAVISEERFRVRGLFNEIGQRLKLSGKEVRYLSPFETADILRGTNAVNLLELRERLKLVTVLGDSGKIQILIGTSALEIEKKELNAVEQNVIMLKGNIANSGIVKGTAKIIHTILDLQKINPNDILITHMTTPDMVPAMEKASAIVTDEGGLLCHAAIVSRELKKPCLIGTKNATKIFKDGDLVEVNTVTGIVRKLSI